MKTNNSTRSLVKIRRTLSCLALVAMVAGSFAVGSYLATRLAQPVPEPAQVQQAPAADLGLLIASR